MLQVVKNLKPQVEYKVKPKTFTIKKNSNVQKLFAKPVKRYHEPQAVPPRAGVPIMETEECLCTLLWQSVIIQAFYDISAEKSVLEDKMHKIGAAKWFFSTGEAAADFEMVCELAGVCKNYVRKLAKKIAKEGEIALKGFNFRTLRKDCSDRAPTPRAKNKKSK